MSQPSASSSSSAAFSPQHSVLVFLKSLATPVVLYAENPAQLQQLYEELKHSIRQANPANPKLLEKPGAGPLRKVCFLDTELAGVALQAEGPRS